MPRLIYSHYVASNLEVVLSKSRYITFTLLRKCGQVSFNNFNNTFMSTHIRSSIFSDLFSVDIFALGSIKHFKHR